MGLKISASEDQSTKDRMRALSSGVEATDRARLSAKPKPFGMCPDDATTDRNQAQAQYDSAVLTNL